MARGFHFLRVVAAALIGMAAVASAQDVGVTQSPIVVLDTEEVFGATILGRSIATDLAEKVQALAAENQRITAELEAEEKELTEKRKTLDAAAFRKLADEFDAKVQRIRVEQDAKQRELQALREAERQSFLDSIAPILSAIAREHGAYVVLEQRNVLLSAGSIDITDEAIERINKALDHGDNQQPDKETSPTGSSDAPEE